MPSTQIAVQDYDELLEAWERVPPYTSYLEIGCSWGGSMGVLASFAERYVGVDLPKGISDRDSAIYASLNEICKGLPRGYLYLADSTEDETAAQIAVHGQFGLCLIDGGHAYETVKRDWELYSPMSDWILLHDIDVCPGVRKFYEEIDLPKTEIHGEYGIGVVECVA